MGTSCGATSLVLTIFGRLRTTQCCEVLGPARFAVHRGASGHVGNVGHPPVTMVDQCDQVAAYLKCGSNSSIHRRTQSPRTRTTTFVPVRS
jgi:hypothetical protein